MTYDTEQITTPNGNNFKIEIEHDACRGAPWEECDGHGAVSEWTTRDKKPGELILRSDRRYKLYYDFQGAVKTAKLERWGCDSLTGNETAGEKAFKSVISDFNYLKAWCGNEWFYACLHVVMLDSDGNKLDGYDDYMGGVEYGISDYWQTVAQEMASEIERRFREDQSAALTTELHRVKDDALFAEGIV